MHRRASRSRVEEWPSSPNGGPSFFGFVAVSAVIFVGGGAISVRAGHVSIDPAGLSICLHGRATPDPQGEDCASQPANPHGKDDSRSSGAAQLRRRVGRRGTCPSRSRSADTHPASGAGVPGARGGEGAAEAVAPTEGRSRPPDTATGIRTRQPEPAH